MRAKQRVIKAYQTQIHDRNMPNPDVETSVAIANLVLLFLVTIPLTLTISQFKGTVRLKLFGLCEVSLWYHQKDLNVYS